MTTSAASVAPVPRSLRLFVMLVGITTLGILLQAVTAGEFVSQEGRDGWITVHDGIADATILFSLVTAIVGLVAVRRVNAALAWTSLILFVLLVAQTVTGHLITDAKLDNLIGLHVPLAFIVFAAAIWLSLRSAMVRRSLGTAAAQ